MVEIIGKISGLVLPFLLIIIAIKLSRQKSKVTKIAIIISVLIALIIFMLVGIYTANILLTLK